MPTERLNADVSGSLAESLACWDQAVPLRRKTYAAPSCALMSPQPITAVSLARPTYGPAKGVGLPAIGHRGAIRGGQDGLLEPGRAGSLEHMGGAGGVVSSCRADEEGARPPA